MTAIVLAGETGVDFSFARPPAARLLELGYTFIVAYISVPPAAPAKNITPAECQAYLNAGLKVLLVWEMSATRPNLGASYGTLDGTSAKQQAGQRDYPTDVPILCAVDTNTTATNVVKQEAYVRAFAVACAPYPIGIYGDTDILGRCAGLWQIGWLPSAWSWSGTSRAEAEAKAKALGAHVLQYTGFYIDQIWAVDPNVAINDFPAWGLTPDPPIPPGGDDDMLRLLAPIDSPARFYATCTPEGAALRCEWTGDGTLPKVDARLAFYRNAHPAGTVPFEMALTVADLINVSLDGPLPPGFTAAQFANTDEIIGRASAVDVTARAAVAALDAKVGGGAWTTTTTWTAP